MMLFPETPITVEHIRAFCAKFNEGYRVEYKRTFDANVREKIPKVLSSFANSHGGVLVIGVNTISGVAEPPFQGFQPLQPEEFPLTIENICLQNIYPPILPKTTVVQSDAPDHVFLVIEVDESAQTPHAIENSKRVYVRTGNAANPYDMAEVDLILELVKRRKEPFERRARLLGRAKKRFNTHLDLKHTDRAGERTNLGTLLQLSIGPRFPSRQLCSQESLKTHIQKSWIRWHGFAFPDPASAILSQYESAIALDAAKGTSIFEVNVWGMLFYGAHIRVEANGTPGINLHAFVGYILVFARHAASMLQALTYSGPVTVEIALSPLLRVNWLHEYYGQHIQTVESSVLDDDITVEIPTTTEALREKPDMVTMEVYRHVFFSVNLPDLVDAPQKLENLIRKGYDYSGWPQPPNILI
jgi:Putative DNA-binding domain